MAQEKYDMSLEIECQQLSGQAEKCRLSFRSVSNLPSHIIFGLDPEHLYPFEEFQQRMSGLPIERHKDLVILIGNSATGALYSMNIDPEKIWPSPMIPVDTRVRLSSLDISKAVTAVTRTDAGKVGEKTIEGAWMKTR